MPLSPLQISDLNNTFGLSDAASAKVALSDAQIEDLNNTFGLTAATAALSNPQVEELNDLFGLTASKTARTDDGIDSNEDLEAELDTPGAPIQPFVTPKVDTNNLDAADPVTTQQILKDVEAALADEPSTAALAALAATEPQYHVATIADLANDTPDVENDRGLRVLVDAAQLIGKSVVLTGKPPAPFHKKDIAERLLSQYKVKAVEPEFTSRTQVVVYSRLQTDTLKLKKALAAGLTILPYDNILN